MFLFTSNYLIGVYPLDLTSFQALPEDIAAYYLRKTEKKIAVPDIAPKQKPLKAKLDLPRPGKGEAFIKGPIPFDWMRTATHCGGRGTEVGLLLWYAAGWQKKNPVRLTAAICKQLGIHPKTSKRVLVRMQGAGLISVEFHRGRSPVVTLMRPEVAVEEEQP